MTFFLKKKDLLRRNFLKNKEFLTLFYKVLAQNSSVSYWYKKKQGSCSTARISSKVQGACIITGRTSAVYRGLKVSRFVLKGMSSVGYLPGVRKSS
jgi:ribosomal protein S14